MGRTGGEDEEEGECMGGPRRSRRFAFSRGPASFLNIAPRHLFPGLANWSASISAPIFAPTGRRSDRELDELENRDNGSGAAQDRWTAGLVVTDLDRSCGKGEEM